jgi:polar amino acid transport system substrate-binding protein
MNQRVEAEPVEADGVRTISRDVGRRGKVLRGAGLLCLGLAMAASGEAANPAAADEYQLPAKVKAAGKLTVASSIGHPPFEFFKEDNKTPTGFDIELMEAIGKRLGVEVRFEDVRFPAIPPGLESGRYDLAISAMRDTEERRKHADFVDYVENSYRLLVSAANPHKVNSLDGLCGLVAGGVSGQTALGYLAPLSARCVKDGKKPIQTLEFPNGAAVLLALMNGRIDAYYDTTATGGYTAKTNRAFQMVGKSDNATVYGIAVQRGDDELVKAIQKALQSLVDDGTYARILGSWGLSDLGLKVITVNKGNG